MRPISGTGNVSRAVNIADIAIASRSLSSREYATILDIHARSAPAQNAFPAPDRTATRAPLEATVAAHADNSAITSSLKALRTSGRLRTTRTTGPSDVIWRCDAIGVRYMRNTPNLGSGIGALKAADRPSASACRVSAGSRIPSSHSLAVE